VELSIHEYLYKPFTLYELFIFFQYEIGVLRYTYSINLQFPKKESGFNEVES
jgi:hypothetical protein